MIELITGSPGTGKTLYLVSEVLGSFEAVGGVPRRLCVAGVPELVVSHEVMDAAQVNPDGWQDLYADVVRAPGAPAVEWVRMGRGGALEACAAADEGARRVPMDWVCWWLWVQPGDVLVVDECQTVLRPMAAGRRAPQYIRTLEVHRHYGIDLVLITQHPQLLHAQVRALIGKHRHLRRLLGSRGCVVYEWDHASPPDRVKDAAKAVWRHKRSAFGSYRSASLHTRQRFGRPWMLYALAGVLVVLPLVTWRAMAGSGVAVNGVGAASVSAAASAASAPVGAAVVLSGARVVAHGSGGADAGSVAGVATGSLSPFAGYELRVVGELGPHRYFVLLASGGAKVAIISERELVRTGHVVSSLAPCVYVVAFRGADRVVTCGAEEALRAAPGPSAPPLMGVDGA